ncbi:hypothetical protein WJX72_008078 [[Myrmecia] bisecta]|uniref:Protein kinase domain-containing protein n=1 Tax=[Myrmecia] bisecta TaxID=41462 RepID=A0AAW1Q4N5_9CHLO
MEGRLTGSLQVSVHCLSPLPQRRTPALLARIWEMGHGEPIVGRKETVEIDDNGTHGHVIRVPSGFEVVEGVRLDKDYAVGKEIAGGNQGAIYELLDSKRTPTPQLLKVLKSKRMVPFTGADIGLKREWLIGQQLNKLKSKDGELHGFMGTGAALVSDGEDGMMEGLILDKVNGMPLNKRMWKDERFANARYVLEMLRQVFAALDRANRELGFVHGDMRIANIMEHRPEMETILPKGFAGKSQLKAQKHAVRDQMFKLPGDDDHRPLKFKIIDYGHSTISKRRTSQALPKVPFFDKIYHRIYSRGDVWRLLNSLSNAIDGRTWPEEDADKVKMITGLVKEVTGVKLHAWYRAAEPAPGQKRRKLKRGLPWQRAGGFGHRIRRALIRIQAFIRPRNTKFTPSEALRYLDTYQAESVNVPAKALP